MYSFVDTIDHTSVADMLPSEALKINNQFIEQAIPGYRTLNVVGRELISQAITSYPVGDTPGEYYESSKLEPRTITVTYQLYAEDAYSYREKFNALNKLLSKPESQLVFNDEPGKYFIGTFGGNSEVEAGRNFVIGEFDFICSDPCKYAITPQRVVAAEDETGKLAMTLENTGNMPCAIDYEITCLGDNGYIEIATDADYMRYGSKEEVDGQTYKASEILLHNTDFLEADITNDGVMFENIVCNGDISVRELSGKNYLMLESRTPVEGRWSGSCITVAVPPDSNGDVGALKCYMYFTTVFQASLMGQTGTLNVAFLDEEDNILFGYDFVKADAAGNSAGCMFFVRHNGVRLNVFTSNHLDTQNPLNVGRGSMDILRDGAKVRFHWWGNYYEYIDSAIADKKVMKIQIGFGQFGTRNLNNDYVTYLGIADMIFRKDYVDNWEDLPNRYKADDLIIIRGDEGIMYVNSLPSVGDEHVGTTYFKAEPGTTTVKINTSSWARDPINVRAEYRERWI